jgi:protein involved in polysaccharide export with SLBB domain
MTIRTHRTIVLCGAGSALAMLLIGLGAAGDNNVDIVARIRPGDRLYLHVFGTLPDAPIKGVYQVEPTGKLPLGPAYGRVQVSGMAVEEAEAEVRKHLAKLVRESHVLVTWYDPSAHGEPALVDRVIKLERDVAELKAEIERIRNPNGQPRKP